MKWITEEREKETSRELIALREHTSLRKAVASVLLRIQLIAGVKMFWVIIPGIRAFNVRKEERKK